MVIAQSRLIRHDTTPKTTESYQSERNFNEQLESPFMDQGTAPPAAKKDYIFVPFRSKRKPSSRMDSMRKMRRLSNQSFAALSVLKC